MSPDFYPAYNPLLAMLQKLRHIDTDETIAFLSALVAANPQRQEAVGLLNNLFHLDDSDEVK